MAESSGWNLHVGCRAVDRRCVNAGQRGVNGVSVVVTRVTAQREGARAGRWAPRATGSVGRVFRGQSEQAVEQFVFLGPAWQGQADQFQAAAADIVAESQNLLVGDGEPCAIFRRDGDVTSLLKNLPTGLAPVGIFNRLLRVMRPPPRS